MYDKTLEELTKKMEVLNGKTLAALADGKVSKYASLKQEEAQLKEKITIRKKEVDELAVSERKKREQSTNSILSNRFESSREGLKDVDPANKKIEVWNGYNRPSRKFAYQELLQKMVTILKQNKSFTVGNRYEGLLSVSMMVGKVNFSYEFSNRNENKFILEATDMDSIEGFVSSLTLLSCETSPEIEHGIGQSVSESQFIYRPERILHDLFDSFAKALYKNEN